MGFELGLPVGRRGDAKECGAALARLESAPFPKVIHYVY